jgi:hypothetical protein
MKRARATMEARKGRVNGLMSGRLRHSLFGATSIKPTLSSKTCGGESTSTCNARHKATRTAVSSGTATCVLEMTFCLFGCCQANDPSSPTAATRRADGDCDGPPPFAAAHG